MTIITFLTMLIAGVLLSGAFLWAGVVYDHLEARRTERLETIRHMLKDGDDYMTWRVLVPKQDKHTGED